MKNLSKLGLYLVLSFILANPNLSARAETVNNLILVIGDGMGIQQLGLLSLDQHYGDYGTKDKTPAYEDMMTQGSYALMRTEPQGKLVADSACSASHLASGIFAQPETLGLNFNLESVPSILEKAKKSGRATALVSDTRITHATPAAFAVHHQRRSEENIIAEKLIESDADIMLSGGLRHFLPKLKTLTDESLLKKLLPELRNSNITLKSKRSDEKNLLMQAKAKGYSLVFDSQTLHAAAGPKVLGLFANSGMPDAIQEASQQTNSTNPVPSLVNMTKESLRLLEQNKKGFFLMVEAGQIDWACHENDAGTLLYEMRRFDQTLQTVLDWANGRDDTLVVVTADHETGGFGFAYSAFPKTQKRPAEPLLDYAEKEVLRLLVNQKISLSLLFEEFDTLPKKAQSSERLAELVLKYTNIKISLEESKAVLALQRNNFLLPTHEKLKDLFIPNTGSQVRYYASNGTDARQALLARVLSREQHVVWATGTHTSTPVLAIAHGPEKWTGRFKGVLHAVDVGEIMQEALGVE